MDRPLTDASALAPIAQSELMSLGRSLLSDAKEIAATPGLTQLPDRLAAMNGLLQGLRTVQRIHHSAIRDHRELEFLETRLRESRARQRVSNSRVRLNDERRESLRVRNLVELAREALLVTERESRIAMEAKKREMLEAESRRRDEINDAKLGLNEPSLEPHESTESYLARRSQETLLAADDPAAEVGAT